MKIMEFLDIVDPARYVVVKEYSWSTGEVREIADTSKGEDVPLDALMEEIGYVTSEEDKIIVEYVKK